MKAHKIYNEEIKNLKISSLPSRPTAPTSFGGRGYTANQVKEAFDALPLFIIERFNELIDDIKATGKDALIASIPTGIYNGHSLSDLIEDILSGAFAEYLSVADITLDEFKTDYDEAVQRIYEHIDTLYAAINEKTIDCGSPAERKE